MFYFEFEGKNKIISWNFFKELTALFLQKPKLRYLYSMLPFQNALGTFNVEAMKRTLYENGELVEDSLEKIIDKLPFTSSQGGSPKKDGRKFFISMLILIRYTRSEDWRARAPRSR